MSPLKASEIEAIEFDLLLEAISRRYGHDFRNYARASVERRIRQYLMKTDCSRVSEIIPKILYNEDFFEDFVTRFSIPVTEIFRDPFVYRSIREKVVPILKTYPFIRIWHAGCASGEEAYSLAILLKEEGMYGKTTFFATDFNDVLLQTAKEGIYDLRNVQQFTRNYQQAGGKGSFSEYYHAQYDAIMIDSALKRNITFANHNLVTDSVFTEAHFILCRNVLIYFNKTLQNQTLRLFRDSLVRGGFLCLGTKESLQFSDVQKDFKVVDERARIYQKRL